MTQTHVGIIPKGLGKHFTFVIIDGFDPLIHLYQTHAISMGRLSLGHPHQS
jgi:hypothetical protein